MLRSTFDGSITRTDDRVLRRARRIEQEQGTQAYRVASRTAPQQTRRAVHQPGPHLGLPPAAGGLDRRIQQQVPAQCSSGGAARSSRATWTRCNKLIFLVDYLSDTMPSFALNSAPARVSRRILNFMRGGFAQSWGRIQQIHTRHRNSAVTTARRARPVRPPDSRRRAGGVAMALERRDPELRRLRHSLTLPDTAGGGPPRRAPGTAPTSQRYTSSFDEHRARHHRHAASQMKSTSCGQARKSVRRPPTTPQPARDPHTEEDRKMTTVEEGPLRRAAMAGTSSRVSTVDGADNTRPRWRGVTALEPGQPRKSPGP